MNKQRQATDESRQARVSVEPSRRKSRAGQPQGGESAQAAAVVERTDMLQSTGEFLASHPALVATAVYAQASTMGIVHMWVVSQRFGIRIMDFAGASDFLLAAFKHPHAMVLSFGFAAVALFAIGMYTLRAHRYRVLEPSHFTESHVTRMYYVWQGLLILVIVYTVVPPLSAGFFHAEKVTRGEASRITVELRTSASPAISSKLEGEVFLIGATEEFVFFYELTEKRTHVVPAANIVHMYDIAVEPMDVSPAASEGVE
jgi:hypothetical protein